MAHIGTLALGFSKMASKGILTDEERDVVRAELEKIAKRPDLLKPTGAVNQSKMGRYLEVSQQLIHKYFKAGEIGPELAAAVATKAGHEHLIDLVRARRPIQLKPGGIDPAVAATITWMRSVNFPEPVILRIEAGRKLAPGVKPLTAAQQMLRAIALKDEYDNDPDGFMRGSPPDLAEPRRGRK